MKGQDSHVFYKTRICKDFLNGSCPYGPGCRYAHGEHELRKPNPEEQERFDRMQGRDMSRERDRDRSEGRQRGGGGGGGGKEPCLDFIHNRCKYGANCRYSHDTEGRVQGPGGGPSRPGLPGPPPGPPNLMTPGGPAPPMPPPGMPNMLNPMMSGMPNPMMMNTMAAAMGMPPMGVGPMGMGMPGVGMGMGVGSMQGVPHMGGMNMQGGTGGGGGGGGMSGPPGPPGALGQQQHNRGDGQGAVGSPKHAQRKPAVGSSLLKPPADARPPPPRAPPPGSSPAKPTPPTSLPPSIAAASKSAPGTVASPKAPQPPATEALAHIADPAVRAEVAYIERVRAVCGILNIGNAAVFSKERPDQVSLALNLVKNRILYRANAYADDVGQYLPPVPVAQPKAA